MADNAADGAGAAAIEISGGPGNDLIRVERSVTFNWVPDPGNSFTFNGDILQFGEDGGGYYEHPSESGPSKAVGSMTFTGVSSSGEFTGAPDEFSFAFTGESLISDYYLNEASFSWNPAGNRLDGHAHSGQSEDVTYFGPDVADHSAFSSSDSLEWLDHGHWALAPDPHDAEVHGGAGNDTIYGGQGSQLLSGGDGDDTLFLGIGADTAFGGAGRDVIHGGRGAQILDGGAGDDTIRGGAGAQLLMGGDGRDRLEAGRGNETLLGGAGRDVFAFADGVRGHLTVGDFAPGQDRIEVARGINGTTVGTLRDLALRVSGDAHGNAVLDLGGGATVTLSHVSAQRAAAHVQDWFKIA